MLENQDDREILWYADLDRNKGKSWMSRYLVMTKGAVSYENGKSADLKQEHCCVNVGYSLSVGSMRPRYRGTCGVTNSYITLTFDSELSMTRRSIERGPMEYTVALV